MNQNILFFDTETTAKDPSEARLVQLAYLLTNEAGDELEAYNQIVQPDGFVIPASVTQIHGISHSLAMERGISGELALAALFMVAREASMLVAHNIWYDMAVIQNEVESRLLDPPADFMGKAGFCTMQSTTNIVRVGWNSKYNTYKRPRLSELYYFLFKANFENAHTAMADVRATAKCYFEIKKRGWI